MKKVLVTVFVFLFFTVAQSFAYNVKDFSSDATILSALRLLQQSGEHDVFSNLRKNAVSMGGRVILINSIYKNAPVEQIACLIAHESCHTARKATLEEETTATEKEAACWAKLRRNGVSYPETKLTKRLNNLAGLYIASVQDNADYIEDKIASSSFYRAQFGLN